jgi:hypothetical protein
VFIPSTSGGGLGHRMTAFYLAVFHAVEVGAAVAVSPDLMSWATPREALTSVAFVPELFGLSRFHTGSDVTSWVSAGLHSTPWGDLTTVQNRVIVEVDAAATSCSGIYRLNIGYPGSCSISPTSYCVGGNVRTAGAFQKIRPILVALHASGSAGQEQLKLPLYANASQAGELTVAWHVRNGDISSRLPF